VKSKALEPQRTLDHRLWHLVGAERVQ
jgi:hypothetical protein